MKKIFTALLIQIFLLITIYSSPKATDIVAKIDNEIITYSELMEQFKLAEKLGKLVQQNISLKETLESMINNVLLKRVASEKKIQVTDQEIEDAMERYKQQYLVQERISPEQYTTRGYDDYLEKAGTNRRELREQTIESLMIQKYIFTEAQAKLKDMTSPTDTEIQKFYYLHYNSYAIPNGVEVKHIFFRTISLNGKPMKDEEQKAVNQLAKEVYQKLLTGQKFDDLCFKYSQDEMSKEAVNPDTQKVDRGYLGILFNGDKRAQDLFGSEIVKKLMTEYQENKFTTPLLGPKGYHIFLIKKMVKQRNLELNEELPTFMTNGQKIKLKDYIKNQMMQQIQQAIIQEEFQKITKELRNKSQIKIYDKNVVES